jgi:hypothetical protein
MNVDQAASAIVQMKAAQVQSDVSMAVAKKALDTIKGDAELVMQLLYASVGIGQNVDLEA